MKNDHMPDTAEILSALKQFNTESKANIADTQLELMAETMYAMSCKKEAKESQNALIEGLRTAASARGIKRLLC